MSDSTSHGGAKSNEWLTVRSVSVDQIIGLRHAVLRAGLPLEAALFDGDSEPATRHLGAFDGLKLLGCASLVRNTWEGHPAWQLRGMAVEPAYQRRGVGRLLLAEADRIVLADADVRMLWCNARTPAVPFYRKLGWTTVSDEFVIETAGPHFKMVKRFENR